MNKKLFTVLFVFALLPVLLLAQEKTILLPSGEVVKHKGDLKDFRITNLNEVKSKDYKSVLGNVHGTDKSVLNVIDTLDFPGPWNVNFGFFGQDWMVMWFEAPADLFLQYAGFACYENTSNMNVELKIVSTNWTREQFMNVGTRRIGYYEALGNGYNDITAFLDNPDRTGGWTAIASPPYDTEPFGNDIWSDAGTGFSILPVGNNVEPVLQWVDMSILQTPDINIGEIFGIALRHTGPTMDADRIGIWGSDAATQPLIKFYTNGRLEPGVDWGWWNRSEYNLYYAAIVEIYGDRPPVFNSFTHISSGVDLGPFTVDANITDDNPGGGSAGVASAYLYWSVDGGATWDSVAMSGSEPNFTGQIPAQPGNTEVIYKLGATDVMGLSSKSEEVTFFVFAPSGAPTLVILNGYEDVSGYPQNYYWGPNVQSGTTTFLHDRWAYGPVPDILNNYTNIIEICLEAPDAYNDSLIKIWLGGDPGRNYFLAGQEWLGARYNYVDQDFQPGDFEYDILGIDYSYNDISYDGTTGQSDPSLVWPEAGTLFGQPLLDLFNSLSPPADSMMYNPSFETGNLNWQDGFDIVPGVGVEVDMWVETRGIAGSPAVDTLATQLHRTLTAGNKIAFCAYDPIALNTALDDSYPYYYWIGYDEANTPFQILNWFGIPLDVRDVGGVTPVDFSLTQNYPNPFNPSTTINFSVPQTSKVTLKVYDILGREVATLLNETKNAGNYEVDFEASNLASGMYIYSITAGNYKASKKMMLMK